MSKEVDEPKLLRPSELYNGLERAVKKLGGRVKHCSRNAFAHLSAAEKILDIDPAMAAFRAITAEEEAASALILSIKQKRYPGSDLLDHRSHVHKAALTHLISAVGKVMQVIDIASPTVLLHDTDPPKISIRIDMSKLGLGTPEPLFAVPDQPLNFSIHQGEGTERAHRFEQELQAIAEERGVSEIADLIRNEANQRNRLLYASDTGIPQVTIGDGYLLERRRRVTVLLVLTIAIQQTPMHQLFAVQCLRSLLLALRKIEVANFDFQAPARSGGPVVTARIVPGEDARTNVSWRTLGVFSASFGYSLGTPALHVTYGQS
jgi:hypothetical protein